MQSGDLEVRTSLHSTTAAEKCILPPLEEVDLLLLIPGAPNDGVCAFSCTSYGAQRLIAYGSGNQVVIMNCECAVLQILEDQASRVHCVQWCRRTGHLASVSQNRILLYHPRINEEVQRGSLCWIKAHSISIEKEGSVRSLDWLTPHVIFVAGNEMNVYRALPKRLLVSLGLDLEAEPAQEAESVDGDDDNAPEDENFDDGDSDEIKNEKEDSSQSEWGWVAQWTSPSASPVKRVACSPDGRFVATIGDHDRLVKVFKRVSVKSRWMAFRFAYLPHPRAVTDISWKDSADRRKDRVHVNVLMTSCRDGNVRFWSESSNSTVLFSMCAMVPPSSSDAEKVGCVCWIPECPSDTTLLRLALQGVDCHRAIDEDRDVNWIFQMTGKCGIRLHALEFLDSIPTRTIKVTVSLDIEERAGTRDCRLIGASWSRKNSASPTDVDFMTINREGTLIANRFSRNSDSFVTVSSRGAHFAPILVVASHRKLPLVISLDTDGVVIVWRMEEREPACSTPIFRYLDTLPGMAVRNFVWVPDFPTFFISTMVGTLFAFTVDKDNHLRSMGEIAGCEGIVWSSLRLCCGLTKRAPQEGVLFGFSTVNQKQMHLFRVNCDFPDPEGTRNKRELESHTIFAFEESITAFQTIEGTGNFRKFLVGDELGRVLLCRLSVRRSKSRDAITVVTRLSLDAHAGPVRGLAAAGSTRFASVGQLGGESDRIGAELIIWEAESVQTEFFVESRIMLAEMKSRPSFAMTWITAGNGTHCLAVSCGDVVRIYAPSQPRPRTGCTVWIPIRTARVAVSALTWSVNAVVCSIENRLQFFVGVFRKNRSGDLLIWFNPTEDRSGQDEEGFPPLSRSDPLPMYHPFVLSELLRNNRISVVKQLLFQLRMSLLGKTKFGLGGVGIVELRPLFVEETERAAGTRSPPPMDGSGSPPDATLFGQPPIRRDPLLHLVELLKTKRLPLLTVDEQDTLAALVLACQTTLFSEDASFHGLDPMTRLCLFVFEMHNQKKAWIESRAERLGLEVPSTDSTLNPDFLYALLVDSQQSLLDMCVKPDQDWPAVRSVGAGLWLRERPTIVGLCDRLAKRAYVKQRNPDDSALFYLALRRKNVLLGLYRIAGNQKLLGFLSHDFSEPRWRTAAAKNAYVLRSQGKYELAAAFFLLADNVDDCVAVCANDLKDVQLGIFIANVYCTDREMFFLIVRKYVLERADQEEDVWLSVYGYLLINMPSHALAALAPSKVHGNGRNRTLRWELRMIRFYVVLWERAVAAPKQRNADSSKTPGYLRLTTEQIRSFLGYLYFQSGAPLITLEHLRQPRIPRSSSFSAFGKKSVQEVLSRLAKMEGETVKLAESEEEENENEHLPQVASIELQGELRVEQRRCAALLFMTQQCEGIVLQTPWQTGMQLLGENATVLCHRYGVVFDSLLSSLGEFCVHGGLLRQRCMLLSLAGKDGMIRRALEDASRIVFSVVESMMSPRGPALASRFLVLAREMYDCQQNALDSSVRRDPSIVAAVVTSLFFGFALLQNVHSMLSVLRHFPIVETPYSPHVVALLRCYAFSENPPTAVDSILAVAPVGSGQLTDHLTVTSSETSTLSSSVTSDGSSGSSEISEPREVSSDGEEVPGTIAVPKVPNVFQPEDPFARFTQKRKKSRKKSDTSSTRESDRSDSLAHSFRTHAHTLMRPGQKPSVPIDFFHAEDVTEDRGRRLFCDQECPSHRLLFLFSIAQFYSLLRQYLMAPSSPLLAPTSRSSPVVNERVSLRRRVHRAKNRLKVKRSATGESPSSGTQTLIRNPRKFSNRMEMASLRQSLEESGILVTDEVRRTPQARTHPMLESLEVLLMRFRSIMARKAPMTLSCGPPDNDADLVESTKAHLSKCADATRLWHYVHSRCGSDMAFDALLGLEREEEIQVAVEDDGPPEFGESVCLFESSQIARSIDFCGTGCVVALGNEVCEFNVGGEEVERDWLSPGKPVTPRTASLSRSIETQWVEANPGNESQYCTAGLDGVVKLWEFGSSKCLQSYGGNSKAHKPRLLKVRFAPWGTRFATGDVGGVLRMWRLEDTVPTTVIDCQAKRISDIAFLDCSTQMMTCQNSANGSNLRFFDALLPPNSREIASCDCLEGGATCAAYLPQSQVICCGGKNGKIVLIDTRKLNRVFHSIDAHSANTRMIAFFDSEKFFATGSTNGEMKIWDLVRCQQVDVWPNVHPRMTFLAGTSARAPLVSTYGVMCLRTRHSSCYSCGSDGKVKVRPML